MISIRDFNGFWMCDVFLFFLINGIKEEVFYNSSDRKKWHAFVVDVTEMDKNKEKMLFSEHLTTSTAK